MPRRFINPAFAKEIELDRPASGWPERVFRLSIYYVVLVGGVAAILDLFFDEAEMGKAMGTPGIVLGSLFGVCFFYMLNYAVFRFVKSKVIKVAWWSLMALVTLLVGLSVLER